MSKLFSIPLWGSALALWLALASPEASLAAAVSISPDITVDLAGTTFNDEDVAFDDQAGTVLLQPLGGFANASDITAYHLFLTGDHLYVLETTTDLGGGLTVEPRDVVRYDNAVDTLEFDGSAAGLPDGVAIDAVTVDGMGDLVLSFDTTVDLGGGLTVDDEDLVTWDGMSFALFFDGSTEGVDPALDVDGAYYRVNGDLVFLSFDGSGSVGAGAVSFDDEDILELDGAGTWSLSYDGSANHPSLGAADVIALPEPATWVGLACGGALIAALQRRRSARAS